MTDFSDAYTVFDLGIGQTFLLICNLRGSLNSYNPGQNKLGHWQISVFSSCLLKYRGENIRLEPSHPSSPYFHVEIIKWCLIQSTLKRGELGLRSQRLK